MAPKNSGPDFQPNVDDINNGEEVFYEQNENYMNHYSDIEEENHNAKMPVVDVENANIEEENTNPNDAPTPLSLEIQCHPR